MVPQIVWVLLLLVSASVLRAQPCYPDSNAVIRYEVEPRPVNMDDITSLIGYPAVLRDAGIDDTRAIFRILLNREGKYVRHYVIRKPHQLLLERIEHYLPQLSWTPAIAEGNPVASWVTLPFTICLK